MLVKIDTNIMKPYSFNGRQKFVLKKRNQEHNENLKATKQIMK
jgi:hypothetical protein